MFNFLRTLEDNYIYLHYMCSVLSGLGLDWITLGPTLFVGQQVKSSFLGNFIWVVGLVSHHDGNVNRDSMVLCCKVVSFVVPVPHNLWFDGRELQKQSQ